MPLLSKGTFSIVISQLAKCRSLKPSGGRSQVPAVDMDGRRIRSSVPQRTQRVRYGRTHDGAEAARHGDGDVAEADCGIAQSVVGRCGRG